MVGATNLMTKKLLSLHPYIHDANVTYYDGKKCHYVKIERLKQVKKFRYTADVLDASFIDELKADINMLKFIYF